MVTWWVIVTVVLSTVTFCLFLILIAKSIKASQESAKLRRKKNKSIQVHGSQARVKRATIYRTVNFSHQEGSGGSGVLINRVDVTTDARVIPFSKYSLNHFPWWSYMFVVMGGFMICLFLNYVVNRVNAARFKRYEELHANDPDEPRAKAEELIMQIECPKKAKKEHYAEVNEVKDKTFVFTQVENQKRSKNVKCDSVLGKPTKSEVPLLNVRNTETNDQTVPSKPIQIKDSLLVASSTQKLLERELVERHVKTEPIDLAVGNEQANIVEIKRNFEGKVKHSASTPTLRLIESLNEQISGVKLYSSEATLSNNAEKAENKYG